MVVIRDLLELRQRCDGELAVGVPSVLPLHRSNDLAGSKRLERVESARGRRARAEDAAADRRPRTLRRPSLGQARRLAHPDLRELAPARDDSDLLRDVVRAVAEQLARVQRRRTAATAAGPSAGRAISATRTSGSERCRTGSPSSSQWGRWSSSRSTSASAARPSPSPSAPRTKRPAPRASPRARLSCGRRQQLARRTPPTRRSARRPAAC